jgi:DNA-directed RNA polymerase subunit M/transcription elongation factor TFIIS
MYLLLCFNFIYMIYKIEKNIDITYISYTMNFCRDCSNMLYTSINEDDANKLEYRCRHCGFVDNNITSSGHCVLNTQLNKREQKINYFINKYTKFDPCLPRINTMKCPNEDCNTNKDTVKNPEIIYMRYDDNNLKYAYICTECDFVWKTDSRK